MLVLDSHNTTTPGSAEVNVLIELAHENFGEGFEVLEVFFVNLSQSKASSGLLVNKFSKVSLSSDEAEWHSLLSAESREEANHLDGVNIVSNNNHLGSSIFNKLGDMVQSILDVERLGGFGLITFSGSRFLESGLFLSSSLRAIFSEQFKEFTGLIFFDSVLELSDCWWNLQSLHKNSLLALNSNILGPLNETSEVSLGLDVSPDSKVAWVLFEQRILFAGARCGILITNEHCSFSSFFDHNQ